MREVTIVLRHDRDVAGLHPEPHRRSARQTGVDVGRVHPHVEIKIVDPRTGGPCRAAQPASCARAAIASCSATGTTRGDAPAPSTPARWMHTGDLATMDEDGYVKIVGRIKDMIIRGGENIYPREIEEFLHTHPTSATCRSSAYPSERYGEEVMAWVKLRDGASVTDEELPRSAGPDRHVQDPALLEVRGRVPDDGDGQDPEVPDARDRDRRTWRSAESCSPPEAPSIHEGCASSSAPASASSRMALATPGTTAPRSRAWPRLASSAPSTSASRPPRSRRRRLNGYTVTGSAAG